MIQRIKSGIGRCLATALCEPQVRLGRRRHDGHCDDCGDPITWDCAMERLNFPDRPNGRVTLRDFIRHFREAEYERFCIDCGHARQHPEADHAS